MFCTSLMLCVLNGIIETNETTKCTITFFDCETMDKAHYLMSSDMGFVLYL
jgi:hypothetical protein